MKKNILPDIDVIVAVHGAGDDFFRPSLLADLSEATLESGTPVLRMGNRGRGIVTVFSTSKSNRILGNAFEEVKDCEIDFDAWLQWLQANGLHNIGLIGHSLGAFKCLYYASHRKNIRIKKIVAISPPRFSHQKISNSIFSEDIHSTLSIVNEMVSAGKGKHGDVPNLVQISRDMKNIEVCHIQDTDHFYSGKREVMKGLIMKWFLKGE